ncbi:MoaD family protein [Candidatus Bathyarchaeota archaeon]|nr:MAG: MoaD family protein [Candidatus Bathyarchaeota archaeon]
MEVTVRFIGVFRTISGKSKLTIEYGDMPNVKKAVEKIVEELPKLKGVLIDADLQDPRPNTLILLNEREISILNGLETTLKNGDEIVFVPVSHGG